MTSKAPAKAVRNAVKALHGLRWGKDSDGDMWLEKADGDWLATIIHHSIPTGTYGVTYWGLANDRQYSTFSRLCPAKRWVMHQLYAELGLLPGSN